MQARRRFRPAPPIELSVVIPVFNEQESLPLLIDRLLPVLEGLALSYEVLFVDDGSKDRSREILRSFTQEYASVHAIFFSRNFGHEAASTCGLRHAKGRATVLMDADLQDPPELINEFVARWQAGNQLVVAQRTSRAGEPWIVRASSHAFYRSFRWLARVDIPVDTGDFRLMDRCVVNAIKRLPDRVRYVRGLTHWAGYQQAIVRFDRPARAAGITKYNFSKRFRLAIDAIVGFSDFPPRCLLPTGVLICACALLLGIGYGMATAFSLLPLSGFAWLALFGLVSLGIQISALGVVAEYAARGLSESRKRPVYLIERKLRSNLSLQRKAA